tara:strand:+ start:316 stop:573 length:258 start_codon:yes stop_codon:yes gene_type:complete
MEVESEGYYIGASNDSSGFRAAFMEYVEKNAPDEKVKKQIQSIAKNFKKDVHALNKHAKHMEYWAKKCFKHPKYCKRILELAGYV